MGVITRCLLYLTKLNVFLFQFLIKFNRNSSDFFPLTSFAQLISENCKDIVRWGMPVYLISIPSIFCFRCWIKWRLCNDMQSNLFKCVNKIYIYLYGLCGSPSRKHAEWSFSLAVYSFQEVIIMWMFMLELTSTTIKIILMWTTRDNSLT